MNGRVETDMKLPFFGRGTHSRTIEAVYGAIVAQARAPAIYREFGIPDTLEARFEVLILHLSIVLDRLAAEPAVREIGQGVFDRFCQDMDDHMREMGVGDLAVPKKMRGVADAFYGRREAYRLAVESEDALIASLTRNVYAGVDAGNARELARYILAAKAGLARLSASDAMAGRLVWQNIAAISQTAQNAEFP